MTHLYGVGQGQALQGRADDAVVAEHHEERHEERHEGGDEVQEEGEPADARVEERVVVGVGVVQRLEPSKGRKNTSLKL